MLLYSAVDWVPSRSQGGAAVKGMCSQGSGGRGRRTAHVDADLGQGGPPGPSLRKTKEDSLHEGFVYKPRESHPRATPSSPRRKS